MKNLHKEFVRLGRERNRITYKLMALLPKINKLKIYEKEGYANIYDYAARIAGLSPGVVNKALKLEEKLQNMPHLQKAIETQGINKVGIVAGLATKENEKDLAEKVKHMSKPALQEYSKEIRGKVTNSWKVELDRDMMFMFLRLKKKFGKNLSNKECLRKILKKMQEKTKIQKASQKKRQKQRKVHKQAMEQSEKRSKKQMLKQAQRQAQKSAKIPGENAKLQRQRQKSVKILEENLKKSEKFSRYISIHKKRKLDNQCVHADCHRPAEIIHHTDRFSQCHNHENLKPLCKQHHEFAHNGISEPMQYTDLQYRKYRHEALV